MHFFENMAVTCIAQHPIYPDTMYFGTGEGMVPDVSLTGVPPLGVRGLGVWFSTDGGDTWDKMPNNVDLTNNANPSFSTCFSFLQKLVVKDNGDLFAATKENYVMRLPQGAATDSLKWSYVQRFFDGLFYYPFITDLEIAPDGTFYAGAATSNPTLRAAALFTSPDGLTWTKLNTLPTSGSASFRVEVACAPGINPGDTSIVFVATTSGPGTFITPTPCGPISKQYAVNGIFRSLDGGAAWDTLSMPEDVDPCVAPDFANGQALYDLALAINPNDPDMIYVGGLNLHRSTDGGISWDQVSDGHGNFGLQEVHVDQHTIVIDENMPDLVYFGNDGGVYRSDNGEVAAPDVPDLMARNEGFRVTQLYTVAPHPHTFSSLIGTQDNNTRQFDPSFNGTLQPTTVPSGLIGDGGYCFISDVDPKIQLASAIRNFWYLSQDGGQTFSPLPINNNENSGLFINPAAYDAQNDILYAYAGTGAFTQRDKIMRVRNVTGVIREVDILRLDPSLGDFYITNIQLYEHAPNTLLIGTAAGPSPNVKPKLFKLINADSVETGPGNSLLQQGALIPIYPTLGSQSFPNNANISCVAVDPNQSGHLAVTMYNFNMISVYETTNEGFSWTKLDVATQPSLPQIPVRWAVFNPNDSKQLLLGTEVGVWATDSIAGPLTVWHPANKNLANVRIDMLKVRPLDNIIYAATHGRGLFMTECFITQKADFTVNTQIPCEDQMLHFTNLSIGDTTWAWDFDGDGIVDDTTENPSTCVYGPDITLTINGNVHLFKTKQNYIIVNTLCTSNDCPGDPPPDERLGRDNPSTLGVFPNPFSAATTIVFDLDQKAVVSLEIYDLQGKKFIPSLRIASYQKGRRGIPLKPIC